MLRVSQSIAIFACLSFCLSASAEELRPWRTFQKHSLIDKFFTEGAAIGDCNRDGHPDLVSGPFWFAGPAFTERHEYSPAKPFDPHGYSDNFFAFTHDLNGDGWTDILIYGFPGQDASWFENPQGQAGYWKRHRALDVVDNESPTWGDLTGDGRPEIICSSGGYFGYASPDWANPTAPWTFHRLSDESAGGRFTHGLGWGDVNSDGRADLLEKNGWWEQPASLAGDPVWTKHSVAFSGPGGAQMYAYDVDGDGLNDVITSLQAHGFGIVWHQQVKAADGVISFTPQTILTDKAADNPYGVKFSQIHAIDLVDMNGDGLKDIVTGKRYWAHGPKGDPEPEAPAVLYWFQLVRNADGSVDWVPHLIDDNSGVGVQVVAGDVSGDGLPDVVVGNKQGIFAHIQQVKNIPQADWEQLQPKKRPKPAEGLSPEAAAQAMTLPPGFQARLVAAEPDVQQPIAMALDDRGRLWVAEAYSYPVRTPEAEARDRILIFEDTDGDARFDRRTVFQEKLNLVSGIEVGFGGVWVGAAPHLLFIPDRDGDDRPDGPPQVLLDGWGYQDTHETLNAFIWGPDGWLYGCHGVFTHSQVGKPGTPAAERTPINAGIWRYHPTRHEFEVFAEGTSNPWGVDFNDRGHAFCTACVIPHLYHVIQGARYQRQAGQHFNPYTYDDIKTIARHRHWVGSQWDNSDRSASNDLGGGHAHSGAMIYQGGVWPERYRNQLFMNNIHGARLNQDRLTAQGSGYLGDAAPDFCFANDSWSQWIYLTYGPDGQVTMIDWYDQNQCHHRREDGHDRSNGRIFKLIYGPYEAVTVDLQRNSDAELIAFQTHTNEWYVRHARRVLQERAANGTLAADTIAEVRRQWKLASGVQALRYLWVLHVIQGLTEDDLQAALQHADADVRAWAVQLACETGSPSRGLLQRFHELAVSDPSPVVRLYLSSALQQLPLAERWQVAEALLTHAEDAQDHNIPLVNWYGIEPLVLSDPSRALALATRTPQQVPARFIVRRMAADKEGLQPLLAHLVTADPDDQTWMLSEVAAALKLQGNLSAPPAWQQAFEVLMKLDNPQVRQQAEFVAVKFGDERVLPALRATLSDRGIDLERRQLALTSLLAGRDRQLPSILRGLLDDPALQLSAINGLAAFDDPETAKALLKVYPTLETETKAAAVATLTARPNSVLELLEAMAAGAFPRSDLSAFTVRQLLQLKNERVTQRLNEVWGTTRATSADRMAELTKYKKQLKPELIAAADLPHGRELFNKTCASCHVLFDSGKKIGPDLTGSNRANHDYLLENLLDPSAVVGRDYQMTIIVTDDGRALNGIVKEESDSALVLQTPTDLVTITKSEIEDRKLAELSLMPEGQLKTLSASDVRDLVAYLGSPSQVPLPGEGPWIDPGTGKVAGALEGESLKVSRISRGNAHSQPMGAFTLSKWSGNAQLWWTGAQPKETLVLDIPVTEAGQYSIFVALTKAVDYGIVQLTWDDQPALAPIDLYNRGVISSGPVALGTHDLAAGTHRLTIEIMGAHPQAAKGYMFGLDYVALQRR